MFGTKNFESNYCHLFILLRRPELGIKYELALVLSKCHLFLYLEPTKENETKN